MTTTSTLQANGRQHVADGAGGTPHTVGGYRPTLKLDWCDRRAAKYAVEHWHYSGTLPCGKLVTVGAWEDERFIGAVVFGRGATPQVAKHFKVKQTQMAELVRVALRDHIAPTSKIVAIALRMLSRQSPGLGFVVSFADDTNQGHVGTIYQAGNWIYLGESKARWLNIDGVERHPRLQLRGFRRKNPGARITYTADKIKHRYVFPFTDEFRKRFTAQARPYPKRSAQQQRARSVDSDAAAIQAEEGGATPTLALSLAMGKKTPMI